MKMILLTEGETMSRLFDLDWQLLADSCLMIIAIFVLFLALSYFLFNPARKFLNDRKEKIRGELEEAKTSQEKAAELKEQYEAKLKDIDKEAEDEEVRIIRTKQFDMKPMYPEDACVQMELLGHNFFVFFNAETEQVNVVYKRKGNTYGLIEPEF